MNALGFELSTIFYGAFMRCRILAAMFGTHPETKLVWVLSEMW